VVCVAGLASSTLEAKYGALGLYHVTYCSISALATYPVETLQGLKLRLTKGNLRDGREVTSTASMSGVRVRPVRGTAGISSLNPGEKIPVAVWKELIDALSGKMNLHAVNYDWRRWGDLLYAEELATNFRKTIEASISKGAGKAVIVAHSMGAPVVLYCLSAQGDRWVENHVDQVILVAPAHMGSPCMLPSFAVGPINTTAESMIPAHFLEHQIGDICSTWACMIAEMPVHVGGIAPWPSDYAFAFTPARQYGLADVGQFLEDVARHNGQREFGPALFPGVQELASKMRAPPVPAHIIYSDARDTIAQVEYETSDVSLRPRIKSKEPGDGTIVAASITRVAKQWVEAGAQVVLHKAPGDISHKDLIACDFTIDLIHKQVLGPKRA